MLDPPSIQNLSHDLAFALEITGPILIILILGAGFRRLRLIDEHFIASGNTLVYNLALPCLLFFSTANSPLRESLDTRLVLFGTVATALIVMLLSFIAPLFVAREKCGVFIQGAFRGNMGIIGIAFLANAYGSGILAKASIYLALLTIVYNLLSVWVLRNKSQSFLGFFLKNPLIVAVVLGGLVAATGLRIPALLQSAGNSLASLTLPLALLCIGGSLRWASFRANQQSVIWASVFKLIVVPALATWGALWYGFRGEDLALLFLMMATPTAAASYVMAKQMTSHGEMAAEIIALTTGACAVTVTAGLVFLKSGNYI
jgi:predicted permease